MKTNRRNFLKLSAAAATVGPTILIPRFAHATPGFGLTKHVLVLYAKGGFRSHCTFNAVGEAMRHNPFGVAAPLGGRDWSLGAAAGTATFPTTLPGGTVPSFASVSNFATVLGCVDHNPGGAVDVDHRTAANRIATANPEGTTGVLSVIGRDHAMYAANGFTLSAVPPVEINPTEFGLGSGSFAITRPLSVSSSGGFSIDQEIGQGWKMNARAALNDRFINTRARTYRARLAQFLDSKEKAAIFAPLLKDPLLQVTSTEPANMAAAANGVTNAQLIEVLGDYDLSMIGDPQMGIRSWGGDVAMALRFFGQGSPMAVVTRDIYDLHDQEEDAYVPRVRDLIRQLGGLHFLLKYMDHPDGGKFWDHTIVLTASEFSRNNTTASGFNSGAGSDHVGQEPGPARNQAICMMGGPIEGVAGQLIGPTDNQINALDQAEVFNSKRLLATIYDALGIDSSTYFPDAAISELYA